MSLQYDEYLREHIKNVEHGLHWLADNLDLTVCGVQETDIPVNVAMHDQSKSDAEEYNPYDAYFYGGNKSYKVVRDFDYAWLRHIHRNPHHWQYWVLINDDDGIKPLEIPVRYVLEMIGDWWSFSWKSGNLMEIFDWYDEHKDKMILHPKTRKLVEKILDEMRRLLTDKEAEEYLNHSGIKDEDPKYGVPEQKKFPLPDKDHVRSAIRFFNYVEPKYEKELAEAILKRMKEYGLTFEDFGVGDENRFKNYIPKKDQEED